MKENKKGTVPKDSTKDQIYYITKKLQKLCAIFFIVFVALTIAGEFLHSQALTCTSFGFAIAIIFVDWILYGEENEDE